MKRETLPVSRKFYADITSRINSSLAGAKKSADEALRLVGCHMRGEKAVSADCMAMLAFNMIRPEIDRAMERSRRARESAARRKKPEEPAARPTIRLNRRQRRAAERLKNKILSQIRSMQAPAPGRSQNSVKARGSNDRMEGRI